jgi:hypothetical protein
MTVVTDVTAHNTTQPTQALAPFRCFLRWDLGDGTDSLGADPDGFVYYEFEGAADQAEALAGLNPGAAIEVADSLGRRVAW